MKTRRLNLDLFKVFTDLAQTKSFSQTAQQNFLTQSAISQQIAFLEHFFKKPLIERGKRHFVLTADGQVLLEGSRRLLEAYQEIEDRLATTEEISGVIRIETIYSIGLYHLSPYVKTFMKRFPKVSLQVAYVHADRIYSDVQQGVCDFGIVAYPWASQSLKIIPIHKERLVLVGSLDTIRTLPTKWNWSDLNGKPFIAFRRDIPTRKEIDMLLNRKRTVVQIVQEFDNIETLKRTVEIGMGLSIVPENTVAQEVRSRTLFTRPLPGGPYYRPTALLHRKHRRLSRAMQAFIQWMSRPLSL